MDTLTTAHIVRILHAHMLPARVTTDGAVLALVTSTQATPQVGGGWGAPYREVQAWEVAPQTLTGLRAFLGY